MGLCFPFHLLTLLYAMKTLDKRDILYTRRIPDVSIYSVKQVLPDYPNEYDNGYVLITLDLTMRNSDIKLSYRLSVEDTGWLPEEPVGSIVDVILYNDCYNAPEDIPLIERLEPRKFGL